MTRTAAINKKREANEPFLSLVCILSLCILLIFSRTVAGGIRNGIELCLNTIIPTLFPFFILSDLWAATIAVKRGGRITTVYEKIFGISASTIPAFLLGSVCGFPLGIRTAVGQYERGEINKGDLERICGFANNPSAAFVISGVGAGLYGDVKVGLLLYISVLFSAILIGVLSRGRTRISRNSADIPRQSFNIVESVKSAAMSSITVSSYIIFFSGVVELLSNVCSDGLIFALLSGLLEITNGAKAAASLQPGGATASYLITAFSLGFSGLSVHMQAFAFMPRELSRSRYLLTKLIQGILCTLIAFIVLAVSKKAVV